MPHTVVPAQDTFWISIPEPSSISTVCIHLSSQPLTEAKPGSSHRYTLLIEMTVRRNCTNISKSSALKNRLITQGGDVSLISSLFRAPDRHPCCSFIGEASKILEDFFSTHFMGSDDLRRLYVEGGVQLLGACWAPAAVASTPAALTLRVSSSLMQMVLSPHSGVTLHHVILNLVA